jgi:hypothetical protein
MWIEREISIGDVEHLLDEYEIEVDSPDGWVGVNYFVDKGEWDEYVLETMKTNTKIICNENHLFETIGGWKYAKDLDGKTDVFITREGTEVGRVYKTGKRVPIVDINVEHENHRYYTENVSSHNTGVGKSLFMCSMAANLLESGHNILYLTMEMAEEKISQRIDQNLLNLTQEELDKVAKDSFIKRFDALKMQTKGQMVVKEYPTKTAHVGHFKALLKELRQKKDFEPDVVFIDYLNICGSATAPKGSNSYTEIKAIAEELRGMAMEFGIPIITATQTNRTGYSDADMDLTNVSESFGLPMTADWFMGISTNDRLKEEGMVRFTQLKNRFSDPSDRRNWMLGVDYAKMRVFDLEHQPETIDAQNDAIKNPQTDTKSVLDVKWG